MIKASFSLQILWSQLWIWEVKTFLHMSTEQCLKPQRQPLESIFLNRVCLGLQLSADTSWFRPIIIDFCFQVSFSIESVYSWEPALLLTTGNESEKGEKAQLVHSQLKHFYKYILHSQLKHFDKYISMAVHYMSPWICCSKSINWQSSWPTSR